MGEKILALFPDNDVTQSKAWGKARKKKGSKDMIAAVETYYGELSQGKISALDFAKQEAPETIKKAGKAFSKFQKAPGNTTRP